MSFQLCFTLHSNLQFVTKFPPVGKINFNLFHLKEGAYSKKKRVLQSQIPIDYDDENYEYDDDNCDAYDDDTDQKPDKAVVRFFVTL